MTDTSSLHPQNIICNDVGMYQSLRQNYWDTVLDAPAPSPPQTSPSLSPAPTPPSISSDEQGNNSRPKSKSSSSSSSSLSSSSTSTSSWTSTTTTATAANCSSIPSSHTDSRPNIYIKYKQNHAPPLPPSPTLTRYALSSADPASIQECLDRPHPCPLCPARFRQRSHLTAHYRVVHYKCKPFVCSHCNHSFGKKYDLKMHVAAVHFRVRAFQCDKCPKSFAKKSNLSRHQSHRHPNCSNSIKKS